MPTYGFLVWRVRVAPKDTLQRYQQRRQAEPHRSAHGYSRRVHSAKTETTALNELEQSRRRIDQPDTSQLESLPKGFAKSVAGIVATLATATCRFMSDLISAPLPADSLIVITCTSKKHSNKQLPCWGCPIRNISN